MTRHQRCDVRVAPEVRRALRQVRSPSDSTRLRAMFVTLIERLEHDGTRTRGAKKLRPLDLWEVRLDDYRAFFCPVRGSAMIAVAALEPERRKKSQWRDCD